MKKVLALLLVVSLCVPMIVSCGNNSNTPAASSNPSSGNQTPSSGSPANTDPIKVGVLAPLTGTMAEFGTTYEVAMTMALEEINAAGGINGRPLELQFADSKGDQKESADLAARFVDDDDIVAVLGDFSSGCAMAAAPVCDEAGCVLFSPTASNAAFAPMSPYCFQIAGRADAEGQYLGEYVLGKYAGAKKVGVLYINTDWGKGTFDNFVIGAERAGIEVVAEAYADGESDFSAVITKIRAENPDWALVIDNAPYNAINQIRNSGWDTPIAMCGPSTSMQVIELCGENCEGAITTVSVFYDPSDPIRGPFAEEFTKRAEFSPTVMAGFAYDAVKILAEALTACGDDITRDNVRANLAKIDGSYLTGPIDFTDDGDIYRAYLICEIVDGEYVIKADYDFAET